jgi:acetylglutamate kinase
MHKLHVVKIGGNLIENQKDLSLALSAFGSMDGHKILVHGGGKRTTEICNQLGIPAKMHNGRRITDDAALEVAVMVYAGWANKKIVAELQKNKLNVLGVTGADLNMILAKKRPVTDIDYGWAGDVVKVNRTVIKKLLTDKMDLVFCAITHDQQGQLLNTNADTIAAEIASAMTSDFEVHLHYCFEKKGVLMDVNDSGSVIEHIRKDELTALQKNKIIADGMLPKLHNCFYALENGVQKVFVGNTDMLENENTLKTSLTL